VKSTIVRCLVVCLCALKRVWGRAGHLAISSGRGDGGCRSLDDARNRVAVCTQVVGLEFPLQRMIADGPPSHMVHQDAGVAERSAKRLRECCDKRNWPALHANPARGLQHRRGRAESQSRYGQHPGGGGGGAGNRAAELNGSTNAMYCGESSTCRESSKWVDSARVRVVVEYAVWSGTQYDGWVKEPCRAQLVYWWRTEAGFRWGVMLRRLAPRGALRRISMWEDQTERQKPMRVGAA